MTLPRSQSAAKARKAGVQERLLSAAEVLFGDRGFEGTSVRDIAALAKCNPASVNYYFGGKDNLYVEVWRRLLRTMRESRLASIERVMKGRPNPQIETLLGSYARAFVEPLVGRRAGRRLIQLMAREMIDPRLPRNMFLEEMATPVMTTLGAALMRLCPGLGQAQARLAILSVVGQLVHTIHAVVMLQDSSDPALPKLDIEEVLDHIVRFSAAGIKACAETRSK